MDNPLLRILARLKEKFSKLVKRTSQATRLQYPHFLHRREMLHELAKYPHWKDKIHYLQLFTYSTSSGIWIHSSEEARKTIPAANMELEYPKIHYGCGETIIEGWLNVDQSDQELPGYKKVYLLNKHPFPDNSVRFGFSEDMLEHFEQAESVFFLCEAYRTLIPGGVLRLSFPGLEGVLLKHYTPAHEDRINKGEFEAYHFWGHRHFYSKTELSLVATHIGFKEVNFVEFGQSQYPELCNLDTRVEQRGLNIYVELIK